MSAYFYIRINEVITNNYVHKGYIGLSVKFFYQVWKKGKEKGREKTLKKKRGVEVGVDSFFRGVVVVYNKRRRGVVFY